MSFYDYPIHCKKILAMKIINKALALCIMVCFCFHANAQNKTSTKPSLFSGAPTTIQAAVPELNKAFLAKVGGVVQLNLSNNFTFSGTILSSVQRYSNLASIIIKSASLHNSILALSKRTNDDNSITYVGRIVNDGYADGYELKQSINGNYTFNKIRSEDILQDY